MAIKSPKIISRDLTRYSGKWVAFINGKIVESADSLRSLMEKLKKKHLRKKPSIMLVPRKEEGPYILVI